VSANQLKHLRDLVIAILVFLIIQFEFGMAVNLSDLPNLSPFNFSMINLVSALDQAGVIALTHAVLGTFLVLIAIVNLVISLASKVRSVQIVGILSLLTMVLAETCGVLFTLSGFQNDNFSHGMATNFILTFGLYFLELYFLKPNQSS
jgi:hypothetical protein